MGTVYLVTLTTAIGLSLIVITFTLYCINRVKGINQWLRKQLLWNFVLRLIFEESLETTFCVILQLKYGFGWSRWNYGTSIDLIIAYALSFAIVILPFWMGYNYLVLNLRNWAKEEFEETIGAPMEGLKKKGRLIVVFPVYFIIRRVSFAIITLFLFDKVIIVLFLSMYMTTLSFVYLVNVRPYEEPIELSLDLLNEVTTIIAVDICFLFTDLMDDPKAQYIVGYFYIVIVLGCIAIQIGFLLFEVGSSLKLTIKAIKAKGFTAVFPGFKNINFRRFFSKNKRRRGGEGNFFVKSRENDDSEDDSSS